jgi:mRNA (guanine-N7-)-methyltransferase
MQSKRYKNDSGSWITSIEAHYDNIGESSRDERQRDPAYPLRAANNAIKATLISRFSVGATVLDLACGKGGDLGKWARNACTLYLGIDISAECLQSAQQRARRYVQMETAFQKFDLRSMPLPPLHPTHRFSNVTCMFAFHYFWEDEIHVRRVLETVWQNLAPGGRFLLTLPDAEQIQQRSGTRNATYSIGPISDTGAYCFTLGDRVQECTEFIVPRDKFENLAIEFDLHVLQYVNFRDFFVTIEPETLTAMRVVTPLLDEHNDCLGLYSVAVFEKA